MTDATASCPYCGARKTVVLPEGTDSAFAHPTEGKRWSRLVPTDRSLWPRLFGPKPLKGDREESVRCDRCKSEFHIIFFGAKTDPKKYYDHEFEGSTKTVPLIDHFLSRLPIPYPISSLLFASLFWCIWALPVSVYGGYSKILHDPVALMLVPIMAMMLISIHFHRINVEQLKEPISRILKVKPKFKGWIFERFKCYIIGRPGCLYPVNIAALSFALAYIAFSAINLIILDPRLTTYELPYTEGDIVYTSYASALFGKILWSIFSFIFGTAFWLGISTTWVIYKIGMWLPLEINPYDETGGVKPLGDLALSGVVPLVAAEFVFIPILLGKSPINGSVEIILTVLILGTLIVTTAVFFFTSLLSIHRGLRNIKDETLRKIQNEYQRNYVALLEIISQEDKRDINDEVDTIKSIISSLEPFETRVKSMHTWPYDIAMILKLLGSSILPLVMYLLQRLISMLLHL